MLACAVTFQPSIEALLDDGEGQACALTCDAVAGGQFQRGGSNGEAGGHGAGLAVQFGQGGHKFGL